MNWASIADALSAIFLAAGALFALIAGIGILRFPDLLSRMHPATKPQVLGLIFLLTAEALRVRSWQILGLLLLVVIFQLMTAPVAAHMVGRSGVRTGKLRRDLMVVNELEDNIKDVVKAQILKQKQSQNQKDEPPKE